MMHAQILQYCIFQFFAFCQISIEWQIFGYLHENCKSIEIETKNKHYLHDSWHVTSEVSEIISVPYVRKMIAQ